MMPKELVSGYIQKVLRSGSKAIESPQFQLSDSVFESWESLNSQGRKKHPILKSKSQQYASWDVCTYLYLYLYLYTYI